MDPPLASSLKAVVLFQECSDADTTQGLIGGDDNSEVSASVLIPTIPATDKNCDTGSDDIGTYCEKVYNFCARGELLDTSTSENIGIHAELLEGAVTFKYYTSGKFSTSVSTVKYDPKTATTQPQVTDSELEAYLCDSEGVNAGTNPAAIGMNSVLNLCVHSKNAGASVTVTSLELKQGTQSVSNPIDSTSGPNLVTVVKTITSVEAQTGVTYEKVQVISSLMTSQVYDNTEFSEGVASLEASGSATITYEDGRRELKHLRLLQDLKAEESFNIEFELDRGELPDIAMENNANRASTIGVLGAMASMTFGAFMIM